MMIHTMWRERDRNSRIFRGRFGPLYAAQQRDARGKQPVVAGAIVVDGSHEVAFGRAVGNHWAESRHELNLNAIFQINPRIGYCVALRDGKTIADAAGGRILLIPTT